METQPARDPKEKRYQQALKAHADGILSINEFYAIAKRSGRTTEQAEADLNSHTQKEKANQKAGR